MSKFSTCLWFNNEAEAAANLYINAFEDGQQGKVSYYVDDEHKPKGSVLTVEFTLGEIEFMALNGGPEFTFTPAISFFVDCETEEQLQKLWNTLVVEGKVLMPLDQYPFSEKFGWLEDCFGVSWQLNLAGKKQCITPTLMFSNQKYGKAEEAMNHWLSIFGDGKIEGIQKNEDGTIMQAAFTLRGQPFRVMDSAGKHDFDFTMATSFCVYCENQEEIDRIWAEVTAKGKEWPCGWMEDQYGVYWQIATRDMNTLIDYSDPVRANRVMQALYKMKKIDIATLRDAYNNK